MPTFPTTNKKRSKKSLLLILLLGFLTLPGIIYKYTGNWLTKTAVINKNAGITQTNPDKLKAAIAYASNNNVNVAKNITHEDLSDTKMPAQKESELEEKKDHNSEEIEEHEERERKEHRTGRKERDSEEIEEREERERKEKETGLVQPEDEGEENDMYDGPQFAAAFEFKRTKDPATGRVPREKLLTAIDQTVTSKDAMRANSTASTEALSWIERGPNSDVVGPSNGNTRANSGIASGRIRAILVDSTDATHKTVFIGGVDGGLWKTTDITASPATWTVINDNLSNLAISAICQDPRPGFQNIMYFCTGESYYNSDAVQGNGVFKSTDGGSTWNYLASTSTYVNGTRILCDYQGNVYLATRGTGLLRSTAASGGAAWTNITPAGLVSDICDMEISSTSVAGRLHVVSGIFSTQAYRYTDIPATVAAGTWTSPAAAFPSFSMRAEIACSGNTLYALPANASYQVPTIYKSINGGANWVATTAQPGGGTWASGQGWYALAVDIDPSNPNNCIIGGLDTYKTTDGGATWTQISTWIGTTPVNQYVHADVHKVLWFDGGNKLLFACDGGLHYSSDKGATIRDRNAGLRIKQFYSVAIHPSTTNYFLAGAQDNGVHQFNNAGLSSTVEVTGGDGAYTAIDQNEPQYQFGSYVYNQYRRSSNSGASWSSVNLSATAGQFINPIDYDNIANIMYCGDATGAYRRWTNPQTGSTSAVVSITAISTGNVSAVSVSPYTANRVYFGTDAGKVVIVDGANTIASGSAGTSISTGLPGGYVSCVNQGTTDNNLVMCESNYGIQNVWVSTNGGTSWTAIDGNLPDMPVNWCMFYPGDNTKAYIATATGVWETTLINGASTVWTANATFPTVQTDMLKFRVSDRTLAAATHGRGLWTTTIACPTITVTNPATATGTNGTAFSQTFTQTGALGGATFTINSGTLPTGLTLSAAGVLSGTPTQSGTFPLTLIVTDGFSCTGIGTSYNLVIGTTCATITVTNPATTTGTANTAFTQTFTQQAQRVSNIYH